MAKSDAQRQANRSIRRTTDPDTQVFTPYFASLVTDEFLHLCPGTNLRYINASDMTCMRLATDLTRRIVSLVSPKAWLLRAGVRTGFACPKGASLHSQSLHLRLLGVPTLTLT